MGPKNYKPSKSLGSESVSEEQPFVTRNVNVQMILIGEIPGSLEYTFLVMFDGHVIFDTKWHHKEVVDVGILPLDLLDTYSQELLAEKPLILLLRVAAGKANPKDPDPLNHAENRAGGTVDLLPLVLGEDEIHVKVRLLTFAGQEYGCKVTIHACASGREREDIEKVPLVMTMVSGHCMPPAKDGTTYIASLGLNGVSDPIAMNFGMALCNSDAKKCVWASTCTGAQMFCTAYDAPNDDKFIPPDVDTENDPTCISVYWNSVRRVLVEPILLRERLEMPFHIELAGIPRIGKVDVRGRYMGLVDAKVLLIPAQMTVTVCAKISHFIEAELPENVGPLLELPPASAKTSAREPPLLQDANGHIPYIVIKFDLYQPLVTKIKLVALFDVIGFPPPEKRVPIDELNLEPPPEDPSVDVRKIRQEGGASAVHKELASLACRGAVPMNQGIKRTAANKLLVRVRTMLKQFSPGDCSSYIEWQDTVTGQHAAGRRAVTASFRPQPPPKKLTPIAAAARCRAAADHRLSDRHIDHNLEVTKKHPRVLLSKALRLLEARLDSEAKNYVLRALSSQSRNKFILWVYGAMEYDKGEQSLEKAKAAFRIAVKGDYSDGTSGAIGWAALHAIHHMTDNPHYAFVSAKKMRKAYELNKEWPLFYQRWLETSGEEEYFWVPEVLRTDNPLLIASAFFLCLRCYNFSERLLQCLERGCATRGSRLHLKTRIMPDVYYLRAASLVLRRQMNTALDVTVDGIKRFGPSAILSQMRATCLMVARGWDGECLDALEEAERAGAVIASSLLMQAAENCMKLDPDVALQRAARVHKENPSAHSALLIARIYGRKGELSLAERWAAVAVKYEPLLADGWAVLALLAIGDRNVDRASAMLRTARQVGSVSETIEKQLKKVMRIVKIDALPDSMTNNLCLCDYIPPN